MDKTRRFALALVALFVGLSGFWEDWGTHSLHSRSTSPAEISFEPGETPQDDHFAAPSQSKPVAAKARMASRGDGGVEDIPSETIIMLSAWKPLGVLASAISLLEQYKTREERVTQQSQKQHSDRPHHHQVVLLCCDVEDYNSIQVSIAEQGLVDISAFFVQVEQRSDLWNSRFLFLSAVDYLNVFRNTSRWSHINTVLIDLTRAAVVCAQHLTSMHPAGQGEVYLPMFPARGKGSFSAEYTKTSIFVTLPRDPTMDGSSVGVRLPTFAYSSQAMVASAPTLITLLTETLQRLAHVPSGMAIETVLTETVLELMRGKSIRVLPFPAQHARLLSFVCNKGPESLQHITRCGFGSSAVLINAVTCDVAPLPSVSPLRIEEGCKNMFLKPVYTLEVTTQHSSLLLEDSAASSSVVAAARALWKNMSFKGSEVFPAANQCPQSNKTIVLGIAAGYSPEKIKHFILSFLLHHDPISNASLVLFVKDVSEYSSQSWLKSALDTQRLWLIDFSAYLTHSSQFSQLSRCPIVLSRMVVMLNFLTSSEPEAKRVLHCVSRVLVVDTRDSLFQRDSVASLQTLLERDVGTADGTSFLIFPSERFLLSHQDFLFFGPHVLNRFWVGGAFGMNLFYKIMQSPLSGNWSTSDGLTFPILCGGLYMGSAAAIVDFFDVFVQTAMALGGCAVNDQGLLIGLVAVGLGESRFPHPVLLTDPYTTAFTNGPRGGQEIAWDNSGRVVNCRGEPYAILHQFDRYKALWRNLVARNSGPPF